MTHLEAQRRDALQDHYGIKLREAQDRINELEKDVARWTLRSAAHEGAVYIAVSHLLDWTDAMAEGGVEKIAALEKCHEDTKGFILSVDVKLHERPVSL